MKKSLEEKYTKFSFIDQWVDNLELSSENLKQVFANSSDFVIKSVKVNGKKDITVYTACIDGLISHEFVSDYILKPLVNDIRLVSASDEKNLFQNIESGLIYFTAQKTYKNMRETVDAIMNANVVIVFDELKRAIGFDTKGFQMRSISTPTEETSIRGSKDTFVETIRVNTATIRRKIKSTCLVIEDITVGTVSNTQVSLVYMDNMVNKQMLKELKDRLAAIQVEEVLFPGIIEEQIIENKSTVFPQVDYTEKPDKFCMGIIDGKIGILIDGIPFTILVPITFVDLFQTTDDYSMNRFFVSFFRVTRYLLTTVAIIFPGYFAAVTTFHQELLPSMLAVSIIISREGVPFPLFFELLLLILAFQILIEAGTRIYSSVGSMLSLVGAIVVGEAAINAKFVSPVSVVVVAITTISNYTIPNRDFANGVWIWQLLVLMLSSIFGLFGFVIGVILFIYTLSSIEVLGVPYFTPFVNSNRFDVLMDSFIRPKSNKKHNPEYIQRLK